MSRGGFLLFYLLWLALCVGAVSGARAARGAVVAPPPQRVDEVAIAVPPKPEREGSSPSPEEGAGERVRYDEQACLNYDADFRDVCFQALARQRALRDLEGALDACAEVVRSRLRLECLADVAELHVPTSLDAARSVCPQIPKKKWKHQCYFGIAMALVHLDPSAALATCDDAGMWRDFCRHDVLGEVSVDDVDFVLDVCAREEGDLLTRKTCWHGIGKYIGRQDLDAAIRACGRVPLGPDDLYRENCLHGVGWAAGERMGAAGSAACDRAGAQKDSCLLGVAFQLKRLDPSAAVGICQGVQRGDLRSHCLAFLQR